MSNTNVIKLGFFDMPNILKLTPYKNFCQNDKVMSFHGFQINQIKLVWNLVVCLFCLLVLFICFVYWFYLLVLIFVLFLGFVYLFGFLVCFHSVPINLLQLVWELDQIIRRGLYDHFPHDGKQYVSYRNQI